MSKRVLALLILSLSLAGCFKLEGILNATGGGSLTLSYSVGEDTSVAAVRKQVEGPDVKVENVEIANKRATVRLSFANVSKLGSTPIFKDLKVTWDKDDKGNGTFVGRYLSAKPQELNDQILDKLGREVTIDLTFPGDVVDSNARTVTGNKASWVLPTKDFAGPSGITLKATFKLAAAAASPPAASAAAGTPAAPTAAANN